MGVVPKEFQRTSTDLPIIYNQDGCENVYVRNNIPDTGIYNCITGTVIYNGERYEGVSLDCLFSLNDNKFIANADILVQTG